jgi:DNA-binding transcriptional MerR regulator
MGPNELALLLKKLQYHWFWGMYVDELERDSRFHDYVSEFLIHPDKRHQAIVEQSRIDQSALVVRFFYWLFSPAYVVRAYALAACKLLEDEPSDGHTSWEPVQFSLGWATQSLMLLCQKTLKSMALVPIASERLEDVQTTQTIHPPTSFQITPRMVPLFSILGLTVQSGDVMLMADFKKLANRCRRTAHPDKNNGQDRLFNLTETAIKAIKALLDPSSNQSDELSISESSFETLEEKIRAFRQELAEYRAKIEKLERERAEDRAKIDTLERERAEDRAAIAFLQSQVAALLAAAQTAAAGAAVASTAIMLAATDAAVAPIAAVPIATEVLPAAATDATTGLGRLSDLRARLFQAAGTDATAGVDVAAAAGAGAQVRR